MEANGSFSLDLFVRSRSQSCPVQTVLAASWLYYHYTCFATLTKLLFRVLFLARVMYSVMYNLPSKYSESGYRTKRKEMRLRHHFLILSGFSSLFWEREPSDVTGGMTEMKGEWILGTRFLVFSNASWRQTLCLSHKQVNCLQSRSRKNRNTFLLQNKLNKRVGLNVIRTL